MQPSATPQQFNELISWRGTWLVGNTYDRGEAVYHEGSTYLCRQDDVTGTEPGTDGDVWSTLASGLSQFSRGAVVLEPSGSDDIVTWRAPFACTAVAVRGYHVGGTSVDVNASVEGADLLAADLTVGTAETWAASTTLQNEDVAAGDTLSIHVRSVTGSPSQVAVQVDFVRD